MRAFLASCLVFLPVCTPGIVDVFPASAQTAMSGAPSLQEFLARAHTFETTKQYDQAAAIYREYLAARPEDDEVRGALARVLSWQGKYDEAVALYEEILTRHPVDFDMRVALARVKSWQHKFVEAQTLYEGVLHEDRKQLDAKRGLADTFYWGGKYAQALHLYEELFAATPDPEIARRIEAVKAELMPSPRALVGKDKSRPSLPFRDYFKIGYSHFTYTKGIPDEQDWLFEAAKPFGAQTVIGRVEALDRFGLHDTLLSRELYSPLWEKAWGYLSTSVGMDPQFTPRWTVGGEIYQGLRVLHPTLSVFELSFGYRRMSFRETTVNLLTPGLTVYFPHDIWLTEKMYYVSNTGAKTLSSQLTWRVNDRLQLFMLGAFGKAGERLVAVQDFTRVNTHIIHGGVIFPLTLRLSVETWGYYEDRSSQYVRRGGAFNMIFHW